MNAPVLSVKPVSPPEIPSRTNFALSRSPMNTAGTAPVKFEAVIVAVMYPF